MDKITKKITELLSCEYEIFPPQRDVERVMERYDELKGDGLEQGFTPVILVPGEALFQQLKNAKSPEAYLTEYQKHEGKAILEGYLKEIKDCLKRQGEDWEEVVNTVERGMEIDEFVGYMPDDWDESLEIIFVKAPTKKPWEIFAWIPMGGWNECPPTEYIMAIMKCWYEQYHFEPMVICSDMIEGKVPNKPKSAKEAVDIGIEHYAFCPDLIEQCCGDATIGQWADTMLQSYIWFFWWD